MNNPHNQAIKDRPQKPWAGLASLAFYGVVMCKGINMLRFIVLVLFVTTTYASSVVDELEERNKVAVASPEGEKYEMNAVMAFWASPHFMMQCLPPGSPIHDPFSVFFEVMENGGMGALVFTETDHVTECITKNVISRIFPIPAKPFVVRIDLSFTE